MTPRPKRALTFRVVIRHLPTCKVPIERLAPAQLAAGLVGYHRR